LKKRDIIIINNNKNKITKFGHLVDKPLSLEYSLIQKIKLIIIFLTLYLTTSNNKNNIMYPFLIHL